MEPDSSGKSVDWRTRSRALDEDRADALPEEVRAEYWESVAVRKRAMSVITRRHRLSRAKATLAAKLTAVVSQEDDASIRAQLAQTEVDQVELEEEYELIKAEASEAEGVFQEKLLNFRVSTVPECRRNEAKSLLVEEREALLALSRETYPGYETHFKAIGHYEMLRYRISQAESHGELGTVKALSEKLGVARVGAEEARVALKNHQDRSAAIHADFENRLSALSTSMVC